MLLSGCSIDNHNYFENSKRVKEGMTLNETVKLMGGSPVTIYADVDSNMVESNIVLLYYDKKEGWEIRITFNDSLRVEMVGHDD
ncbi:MAG: hypothetical protein R2760_07220 [Chitinophagales bacterium]